MKLTLTFLILFFPAFVSAALIARAKSTSIWGRFLDALAFGPPIAMSTTSLTFFYWRYFQHERPSIAIYAGSQAFILLLFIVAFVKRRQEPAKQNSMPASPLEAALRVIAWSALALSSVLFWKRIEIAPRGGWDGMAIWNLLGRFYARFDGSVAERLELFHLSHTEYPLFFTGTLASVINLSGTEALASSHVLSFLGLSSFALIVQRIGRRITSPSAGYFGMILVLMTPIYAHRSAMTYVDIFVGSWNLIALGSLALAFQYREKSGLKIYLAGLALGLLPWTKNEGWIYATVIVGCFFLIGAIPKTSRGWALRALPKLAIAAAPGLTAWLIFRSEWAPSDRLTEGGTAPILEALRSPDRWLLTWDYFWAEVSNKQNLDIFDFQEGRNKISRRWGLFWPATLLSLIVCSFRKGTFKRENVLVFFAALFQLVAVLLVFVSIEKQEWHLQTALYRLLQQIAPAWVLLIMMLMPSEQLTIRSDSRPLEETQSEI